MLLLHRSATSSSGFTDTVHNVYGLISKIQEALCACTNQGSTPSTSPELLDRVLVFGVFYGSPKEGQVTEEACLPSATAAAILLLKTHSRGVPVDHICVL